MNDLVRKKSAGVIFSDLECTLIGGAQTWTWEEYIESCKKVASLINLIISQNNYFVIVSSCYHATVGHVARKFNIIYNFLSDQNKDKMIFFCSNTGKNTIEKIDDVNVHMIEAKEECIDIVLDKLKNEGFELNNIFGIGDDEKDLNMLFKIQELGGAVGVIADSSMRTLNLIDYLDFDNLTIEDITNNIIEAEFHIEINRLIRQKLEEAKLQSIHAFKHLSNSDEYKNLCKRKEQRKQELIEGYTNSLIDNDALQKCFITAQLANRYYSRYVQRKELNGEVVDENIQQRIYSVTRNMASQAISTSLNLLPEEFVKKLLKGKQKL